MSEAQGRVIVEEGVVFGSGGGRELRCDVYHPPQAGTSRPALLLVHGGAWRQGDRSQLRGYGILLGREGYVCVACEYRLSGEATWPAQIQDVKAAIRWLRANHARLGVDPEKIAVSGNSAGGHLALVAGGTPDIPAFEGDGGNAGVSSRVAAVISFYGPSRLGRGALPGTGSVVQELMGPAATEEDYRRASPLTYAGPAYPPALLIHGNRDETVPVGDSLRMYEALAAAGAEAELHIYGGQPHAFDAAGPFGRQCALIMRLFLDRYVAQRGAAAK
jgi:acetyl esterase/lipase